VPAVLTSGVRSTQSPLVGRRTEPARRRVRGSRRLRVRRWLRARTRLIEDEFALEELCGDDASSGRSERWRSSRMALCGCRRRSPSRCRVGLVPQSEARPPNHARPHEAHHETVEIQPDRPATPTTSTRLVCDRRMSRPDRHPHRPFPTVAAGTDERHRVRRHRGPGVPSGAGASDDAAGNFLNCTGEQKSRLRSS
jgi:hypothetical protein